MSAWTTFQDAVIALGDEPAVAERGLRFRYCREAPNHTGLMLSWPQLAARVRGAAKRLAAAGVGGGDVVVVHAHDQPVALTAILAAMHLGAIPAAVAPLGAGAPQRLVEQFHGIVAAAGACAVAIDKALDAELVTGYPPLPPQVALDDAPCADTAPVLARARADDACFLQFTSGSTKLPKGVVVTQRMLLANLASICSLAAWGPSERLVGWLPIYHDMSLVGLYLPSVLHRAYGCFFPTSRFGRSPDLWMQLMNEERAAFSAGPNFAFAMANRHAERRPPSGLDLSCVRGIICGSEPIAADVMRRFVALHRPLGLGDALMPAFGMAECTLLATSAPPGRPLAVLRVDRQRLERDGVASVVTSAATTTVELVGCGGPANDVAIGIADRQRGAWRADGTVGEILLRGGGVLDRYHGDAAATAATFTEIAGERWFATGDLGFIVDGDLYVCGRAKDLIIHNGVNYYPADIERALEAAMPDEVRLAAVVDPRQDLADEFPGLGVLFEEARKTDDPSALEARVADVVRAYTGLPVAIALAARGEHLPRTTSGKLVRHEIRRRLREELARRAVAPG